MVLRIPQNSIFQGWISQFIYLGHSRMVRVKMVADRSDFIPQPTNIYKYKYYSLWSGNTNCIACIIPNIIAS